MKKVLKRLVFFILLAQFLYTTYNSGKKLMDGKIGVTVSRGYAEYRLFPSISICFLRQGVKEKDAFPDIDSTLKQTQDDVLDNLRDQANFLYER